MPIALPHSRRLVLVGHCDGCGAKVRYSVQVGTIGPSVALGESIDSWCVACAGRIVVKLKEDHRVALEALPETPADEPEQLPEPAEEREQF